MKLLVFESCLDDVTRQELVLNKKLGKVTNFAQVFTRLEQRFGGTRQSLLRRDLNDLSLGAGRASLEEWREFVVRFKCLIFDLNQLEEMTDEAAYHVLAGKIPPGMWQWVTEKEVEEERKFPILEVCFPCNLNKNSAHASVERNSGGGGRSISRGCDHISLESCF